MTPAVQAQLSSGPNPETKKGKGKGRGKKVAETDEKSDHEGNENSNSRGRGRGGKGRGRGGRGRGRGGKGEGEVVSPRSSSCKRREPASEAEDSEECRDPDAAASDAVPARGSMKKKSALPKGKAKAKAKATTAKPNKAEVSTPKPKAKAKMGKPAVKDDADVAKVKSRKSSAYHKAFTTAIRQGLDKEAAKDAARIVTCPAV